MERGNEKKRWKGVGKGRVRDGGRWGERRKSEESEHCAVVTCA